MDGFGVGGASKEPATGRKGQAKQRHQHIAWHSKTTFRRTRIISAGYLSIFYVFSILRFRGKNGPLVRLTISLQAFFTTHSGQFCIIFATMF
jgi:hypothetical protein